MVGWEGGVRGREGVGFGKGREQLRGGTFG